MSKLIIIVPETAPDQRTLSDLEFQERLTSQVGKLVTLCKQFDEGRFEWAPDIANTLYQWLYDRDGNRAALKSYGYDKWDFFETGGEMPREVIGAANLTNVVVAKYQVEDGTYRQFATFCPNYNSPTDWAAIEFRRWWKQSVARVNYPKKDSFSRARLVSISRNQDSGAHSDEKVQSGFAKLSDKGGFGLSISMRGSSRSLLPVLETLSFQERIDPQYAASGSIRQIAHETLLTLLRYRPDLFGSHIYEVPVTTVFPPEARKAGGAPQVAFENARAQLERLRGAGLFH